MQTICLSSSMRFAALIRETIARGDDIGLEVLFPNLDFDIAKEDLDEATLRWLCEDEFAAITSADALYVLNPDGYIGTLVKIEIGYALGKSKPVYFCETANAIELDCLCSGILPLHDLAAFLEIDT